MADSFFDDAYLGTPPWDIPGPQPVFVALAEAGEITGRVLDVGCGSGENALYLAGRGLAVVGIDSSPRAIAKATRKSSERGLDTTFVVGDALSLEEVEGLGSFETVIDSGCFHSLADEQRGRYTACVASVLSAGGRYRMACFSDSEPGDWGPRRVTGQEIRDLFRAGWVVEAIEPAVFSTLLPGGEAKAWMVKISRA